MTFFYLLLGGWGDRLELRANNGHMGWKGREEDGHGEPSIGRIATGGKNAIDKGRGKVWAKKKKWGSKGPCIR